MLKYLFKVSIVIGVVVFGFMFGLMVIMAGLGLI